MHPLLLLLLLSRFSRVWLCATPQTTAHQAPPSLGFSRQEHWSGLPFPSPMHESEKWKGSHSVMSDSLRPYGLQPTRLLRPWDFPGKSTGLGCHCLLLSLFNLLLLKLNTEEYKVLLCETLIWYECLLILVILMVDFHLCLMTVGNTELNRTLPHVLIFNL